MNIVETIWIHGVAVKPEFNDRIKSISYKGWGSTFHCKNGQNNWFHVALTTPVIVNGSRPKLSKIYLLFSTESGGAASSFVSSIHLYDGKHKVRSLDNLDLSGDHSSAIDVTNSIDLAPPMIIQSGLGISIGVHVPSGPLSEFPVNFATIGAELVE